MAAEAPPHPWIPQDDLRLKNAVEAGASLEALAKGAVQFSRKFTVRELRDRWSSLLYDADVSASASSRMVEFEGSKSNAASKSSRFNRSRELKRKGESLCKQYYSLQKILKMNNVSSIDPSSYQKEEFFDHNFLCVPHADDGGGLEGNFGVGDHSQPLLMDCNAEGRGAANVFRGSECVAIGNPGMEGVGREGCSNGFVEQVSLVAAKGLGENNFFHDTACEDLADHDDDLIDFANALEEDLGPSHASTDEPLWKTIEDVPAPEMPIDVSLGVNGEDAEKTLVIPDDVDGENIGSSQYEGVHSEAMLIDGEVGDELNRSAAISGGDYADIYLTNEDELMLMDVNDKDSMDKSSYESLNPIPLTCPKDVHEYDVSDSCQRQKLVSENLHTAQMDVATEPSQSGQDDQPGISCSEANVPASTSVPRPLTPKLHHEQMICVLNTEDPEIPCNDHVFLPIGRDPAVVKPTIKKASELASSTDKRKCDQQMITLKKEEDPAHPFKVPQMVGHGTITENSPNHEHSSFGVKAACGDSNHVPSVSKLDKNVSADPSQCRSAHAPPKSITNRVLKEEGIEAPFTVTELAPIITEQGSTKKTIPEPEANPSALDHEESEEESDDDADDDADLPYYSDVEQMILEMDLCPHDQGSYMSKEVFQDEDFQKIMRLEQCSGSCIQRELVRKGAFAMLYGRRVEEYIKKTEVILGRATEDNEVDIDLGKEGLHNKISRRQALIKLEEDGSFSLKNIGKSAISLNGKDVATGKLVSLSSFSLIQIREMAFMFVMSHNVVRQHLGKIAQGREDKHTKFDWSPERGP